MKFLILALLISVTSCATNQTSVQRDVANSNYDSATSEIKLFAFINVKSTSSSSTNGDYSSYTWENSYVIGWDETNKRQIVAKAGGCGLVMNRKIAVLNISDSNFSYDGFFAKTGYTNEVTSKAECKNIQSRLKQAQYDKPIYVRVDHARKTFTID